MEKQLAKFGDDGFFIKIKTVKVDPKTGEDHVYWNTTTKIPNTPREKRAKWNAQRDDWDYVDKEDDPPPLQVDTEEPAVADTPQE